MAHSFRSTTSMQDIEGIEEKDWKMTMNQASDVVKKFFEDFERGSNTFERDLLALQFSDPFMAADPDGGIQVVKKDNFLAGIAKRQAFFQSIGFQFGKILHRNSILATLPQKHPPTTSANQEVSSV